MTPGDPIGLGAPVLSLKNALVKDLAGRKTLDIVPVRYDSTDVETLVLDHARYFANLGTGVKWTLSKLSEMATACPRQQIVLAGYSQGAMVMHRVVHMLGTKTQILSRVSAVVLIADGDQVPRDNVTRFGTAPPSALGAGLYFPAVSGSGKAGFSTVTGPRVLSICNTGDIVCDTKPSDLVQGGVHIHLHYAGTAPVLMAARLAAIMTDVSSYAGKGISHPQGITRGPDGALWFTNSVGDSIGRITTSGRIASYKGKGIDDPVSIAAGRDGALWFTNFLNNSIGRITTAGVVSNYTGSGISAPFGITVGPDGALWFVNWGDNSIGRITVTGKITSYGDSSIDSPFWITAGRDGALWFTNSGNNSIGRITTAGVVRNFTGPGIDNPQGITAGPDGALWFANSGNNSIGRITTGGAVSFHVGAGISQPYGITAGPDGALWFANSGDDTIGRISTAGAVTNYTGPRMKGPYDIAAGPDGALWFTNALSNSIGRNAGPAALASPGTWGNAVEVPGTAVLNRGGTAAITSVSCPSAGNCGAGGYYRDTSGNTQAFVVSEVNGAWHAALEVPGSAALNKDGVAQITSVSCASAGNCGAGGYYADAAGHYQAFVANETTGTWGTAREVPGSAALNAGGVAQVDSVSCASAGNCGAGGYYKDGSENPQAFVVSEVSGTWQSAQEVPGSATLNAAGDAEVTSVSCRLAGECTAAGYYTDGSGAQALVVTEQGGTWENAAELPGSAALNTGGGAHITSVSCASAGNCTAGGYYSDNADLFHPMVASELDGAWDNAMALPGAGSLTGTEAEITSVSCASAGNCGAGGHSQDFSGNFLQAFVASQVAGRWGNAAQVPGTKALNATDNAQVTSVSCASPGNCSAGGFYQDASFDLQAFVVSEVNGIWGNAREVPGTAALNEDGHAQVNSVSCGAVANCGAGGSYRDASSSDQAFVVTER
jgi:virginiamycin B lyase